MIDPTWMSPEPHDFHYAGNAPGITCGWCPNWRTTHCVEEGCRTFEESGDTWPGTYIDWDGKRRCWTHRLGAKPASLGL